MNTTKDKEITTLPPELFAQIIGDVLEIVGMQKAVRLRAVNRLFDTTIVDAICSSYLSDRAGPVHKTLTVRIRRGRCLNPQLMGSILHAQMKLTPHDEVLGPVWEAIQSVRNNNNQADEEQLRDEHAVCEAAAEHLYWGLDHQLGFRGLNVSKIENIKPVHPHPVENECIQNAFSAAIITDVVPRVRALLVNGAIVNLENRYFSRPLQLAAKRGNVDIFQLLLDHGADVHAFQQIQLVRPHDLDGVLGEYYSTWGTPLMVASLAGHKSIVELLLQPSHNIDTSGFNYTLAVQAAARGGHPDIVQLLAERYIETDDFTRTTSDRWAFFFASYHGREGVVRMMLENGFDANAFILARLGKYFPSALQLAAVFGHADVMRLLLEYGADRECTKGRLRQNAMHVAVRKGHEEAVQVLLDHGAAINANLENQMCTPAILTAVYYGQSHMVKFLLDHGADINRHTENTTEKLGEVLLAHAVRNGQLPIIRILLNAGVPVNNSNKVLDPILNAMAFEHTHILKMLRSLGGREMHHMDSAFVAECKSGKFPVASQLPVQEECYWRGRY